MTLNWSINQARGQLTFGKLIPMAGNAYEIQLSGRVEGKTYTFYVMDESAEKCLAKSETNAATGAITIAFDQADLRTEFAQEWHEIRNFHTVVSDGTSTLAEGDLPVSWNPVWTEPSTGEAYSMRGPEGAWVESCRFSRTNDVGEYVFRLNFSNGLWCEFVAPRGPQGLPATAGYAYDPADEMWHKLTVVTNVLGQKTLKVEQAGIEEIPSDSVFMRLDSDQTVIGNKTFTGKLKADGSTEVTVPTLADLTDSTTKAASTSWVQSLLSAFWTAAKAAAQTITGAWTFDSIVATTITTTTLNADLVGDVTGDVTGDVNGNVTGSLDATGSGCKAIVPTLFPEVPGFDDRQAVSYAQAKTMNDNVFAAAVGQIATSSQIAAMRTRLKIDLIAGSETGTPITSTGDIVFTKSWDDYDAVMIVPSVAADGRICYPTIVYSWMLNRDIYWSKKKFPTGTGATNETNIDIAIGRGYFSIDSVISNVNKWNVKEIGTGLGIQAIYGIVYEQEDRVDDPLHVMDYENRVDYILDSGEVAVTRDGLLQYGFTAYDDSYSYTTREKQYWPYAEPYYIWVDVSHTVTTKSGTAKVYVKRVGEASFTEVWSASSTTAMNTLEVHAGDVYKFEGTYIESGTTKNGLPTKMGKYSYIPYV